VPQAELARHRGVRRGHGQGAAQPAPRDMLLTQGDRQRGDASISRWPADDLLLLEGMSPDLALTLGAARACVPARILAEQSVDELADIEGLGRRQGGQAHHGPRARARGFEAGN